MSAFIVEDRVINNVLSGVSRLEYYKLKKSLKALGQSFLDLNYESVNYRYSSNAFPRSFKHETILPCSWAQALKSLRCLIYQSCEIPYCKEHPVFKDMLEIESYFVDKILENLEAYQYASWS